MEEIGILGLFGTLTLGDKTNPGDIMTTADRARLVDRMRGGDGRRPTGRLKMVLGHSGIMALVPPLGKVKKNQYKTHISYRINLGFSSKLFLQPNTHSMKYCHSTYRFVALGAD